MRNIYISFLGTNQYIFCNYQFRASEIENVKFVQEATISIFCKQWTSKDKILIFTTEQAYKQNWLGENYKDHSQGLKHKLMRLQSLEKIPPVPFENIMIPDGKSEEEISEIFNKLNELLEENDNVVFDITHSFRSISMLAIVALNYAKILKKIKIKGIYYGAFETLGSKKNALQIPLEKRNAPIFDLTGYDNLLDWARGVDRFIENGDAKLIKELSQRKLSISYKKNKSSSDVLDTIALLAEELLKFTKIMQTCRGREIYSTSAELKHLLSKFKSLSIDFTPSLRSLVEMIEESLEGFNGDTLTDGLNAAKWCRDHGLIQQGFTILEETMISALMDKVFSENEKFRQNTFQNRKAARLALSSFNPQGMVKMKGSTGPLSNKYASILMDNIEFASFFKKLNDVRNDINHAGWRMNSLNAEDFAEFLDNFIREMESIDFK